MIAAFSRRARAFERAATTAMSPPTSSSTITSSSSPSTSTRAVSHASRAVFAKAKGKAAAKDAGAAHAGAVAAASATHVTGLNYFKSGEDPAIGPDDAYPAWLSEILQPKESLGEFERRIAALKENGEDWRETFSEAEKARYTKLARVARMKANNAERAKN